MKVFLTGGTGLLGSHVAERLIREGHSVRALVRPGSVDEHLRSLDLACWPGDITEARTLAGAMAGCEGLVHAGALVVAESTWDAYRRANIIGTENVLAAAAGQGVRRAVHVSTVAVYGGAEVSRRTNVDEDAPTDTPLPPGPRNCGARAILHAIPKHPRGISGKRTANRYASRDTRTHKNHDEIRECRDLRR